MNPYPNAFYTAMRGMLPGNRARRTAQTMRKESVARRANKHAVVSG